MAEKSRFLYQLVRMPAFYTALQNLFGARKAGETLAGSFIKPRPGMRVLDVGCGPGSIRPFLGEVAYTGVDLNEDHIATARERGRPGDIYRVGDVVTDLSFEAESFDRILLIGILHHIDNDSAKILLRRLAELLVKDGRIIACDGVYLKNQRLAAKLMLDMDAGKNVRTKQGYSELCSEAPLRVEVTVKHNLLRIPYDHNIMVLTREA